jgi:hypothetical protein
VFLVVVFFWGGGQIGLSCIMLSRSEP